jgi:DNA-binding protein H-NS
MATYIELKAQIDKLQAQADALKDKEKASVIARIKEAIAAFGLTAADLGLSAGRGRQGRKAGSLKKSGTGEVGSVAKRKTKAKAKRPTTPKYQDGSGNTWSGRGPRPGWIKAALDSGASLESLLAKA